MNLCPTCGEGIEGVSNREGVTAEALGVISVRPLSHAEILTIAWMRPERVPWTARPCGHEVWITNDQGVLRVVPPPTDPDGSGPRSAPEPLDRGPWGGGATPQED